MSGPYEARRALERAMPEAAFHAYVVELAELLGWWIWHDRDSRGNRAGLPDLILVRPPRVLFVELKTETGRTRRDQAEVLSMLADCPGVETYLWRPSQRAELEQILAPSGKAGS